MKIVVISDQHGEKQWKTILSDAEPFELCVFLGDYWDSFHIPYIDQHNNFMDIMEYKRSNLENVICLLGNHCIHYLPIFQSHHERYSGFQEKKSKLIEYELQSAYSEGLLQMAYTHNDVLFTHAGVTQTWLNDVGLVDSWNIANAINEQFLHKPLSFGFVGPDPYGDNKAESPIWVRPRSLLLDKLPTWKMVVGHTNVISINTKDDIWFTDCPTRNPQEYLTIKDGEFKINQICT